MSINNWRLWVGIGVSLLFIVYLAVSLEGCNPIKIGFQGWTLSLEAGTFDECGLIETLKSADYRYAIPAAVIYFIAVFIRSARWQYVLSPLRAIPIRRLYPVVVIGHAGNNVLPAHMGELIRAYYLAQRERFSGSAALATIGVERVYDGITLLALAALSVLLLLLAGEFTGIGDFSQSAIVITAVGVAAVFFSGFVVVTLLAVAPGAARLLYRLSELLPTRFRSQARELIRSFIEGLTILSTPKQHFMLALRTLPVWLGEAAVYLTIAYSFNIQGHFDSAIAFVFAIILVTATSNLASAFPFAIGGIGPFELISQLTLVVLGVPQEVALSYALVAHLVALWLPVNLAGLALMLKHNLSLKQLTVPAEYADPVEPAEPARGV